MRFTEISQNVSLIDLSSTLEWTTGILEDTNALWILVGNHTDAFYLQWKTRVKVVRSSIIHRGEF